MRPLRKSIASRERAAALIIVLAFVVLLTGLAIAYFSRTTSDRPIAHSSFNQGAIVITSPSSSVIGRYAYAVYDEGGLLDMNVAGYPSGTTVTQSGRKGSTAFADLRALGGYPFFNPDGSGVYQVDKLVGWRN